MGKLEIKITNQTIELPCDNEIEPIRGFASNKPIIAKAGSEFWFTAIIEIDSEFVNTKLSAEFITDESDPNDNVHRGRAGFWIGVKDQINLVEFGSPAYDCGKETNIGINVNHWNFGESPSIEFVVEGNKYFKKKIDIAICVSPWFNIRKNEQSEFELKFDVKGKKHGYTAYEKIESKTITFRLNEKEDTQDDSTKFRLMKDFSGFDTEGNGNCIHPKQLCTLSNLEEELNTFDGPVTVSYIGTDTTENIRSIIRYLKFKEELYQKISNLVIYRTEKYDQQIEQDHPALILKEEMSDNKFKLKIETLSKDGTLPKGVSPSEITISTYVTPWAIKDENKQQYSDLLHILMSKNDSVLIAVDPTTSENLVRAKVEEFNLNTYYIDELKLKNRKNHMIKLRNKTTEALIWSKGASS